MSIPPEIAEQRRQKDAFYRSHPQSPLNVLQKAHFPGLRYYDYNPDLALTVTAERVESDTAIQIITTTNEIRQYTRYARFAFTVDGEEAALTIYQTPHGYFLPFVDANAGTETYPAGRYLDLQSRDGVTFAVDFNLAYNPYCAFSEMYSCPITPKENRLSVAIRAGEMLPGDWVAG